MPSFNAGGAATGATAGAAFGPIGMGIGALAGGFLGGGGDGGGPEPADYSRKQFIQNVNPIVNMGGNAALADILAYSDNRETPTASESGPTAQALALFKNPLVLAVAGGLVLVLIMRK